MKPFLRAAGFAARHGRMMLVIGLLLGIALPGLATAMRPWLPELVGLLLFLAALRIGPRQALGVSRDLPVTLAAALVYQVALPLAAAGLIHIGSWHGAALATVLVLMLAASPISGSPNLTVMTGNDPAPALRLMMLGTALLPLTVLPVFWAMPELGSAGAVFTASARLLMVIALAAGAAFLIRGVFWRFPTDDGIRALDGLSAIAMAVVVIALMSAVGPALAASPARFLAWLAAASVANLGLQIVAGLVLARLGLGSNAPGLAIIAGNRNIALFLVALPASITDPLLLFIGCYQIPMYLTPIILGRFHQRTAAWPPAR